MFTGIITDVGYVKDVKRRGDMRVTVVTNFDIGSISMGASICCSGVCLTVVDKGLDCFSVDVSQETLDSTILGNWAIGTPINLERSLHLGEELGGHIVTGHVDGKAEIMSLENAGDSKRLSIKVPQTLKSFIAKKGSVTLDGVSLTVNEVDNDIFGINIIPHTWLNTTFKLAEKGVYMNIEVDIIARYVDRLIQTKG
ncbi:MAG: riboflavin synthase [Rhodospirillaceae bacterium]|nr:riboflavin synthase [Rhodospirillaceae bacterium]